MSKNVRAHFALRCGENSGDSLRAKPPFGRSSRCQVFFTRSPLDTSLQAKFESALSWYKLELPS
jgi:hypothetical protein